MPDAGEYTGEFKDGLYHGYGTKSYDDGYKLIGYWKNGESNGQATEISSDGKSREVIYDKKNKTFMEISKGKNN